MGSDAWKKGKSVVYVPESSLPEDISKARVVLHIGSIQFRIEGEEEEVVPQPRFKDSYVSSSGYMYIPNTVHQMVEPTHIYCVRVSLESSLESKLVDGPFEVKDTREERKPIPGNKEEQRNILWEHCGMEFDIDLSKIHESVVKIEVTRFYEAEFKRSYWNSEQFDEDDDITPRDAVGTSEGQKVVGRATIPLWDFLRAEKKRKIGSDSPLSDLLSGDDCRVTGIRLAKLENDGSGPKHEGALQVLFKINRFLPKRQKRAEKKLDSFDYYVN